MRNIIIFLISVQISLVFSQACCSSGTPIVGNIALPPANNGQWAVALTFDYNNLNDLYSGTEKVDEDFRLRQTTAVIFETSYGISDLFAVNVLGSFVSQERTISSSIPEQNDNYIKAAGLGDAAVLATYRPIRSSILNPFSLDIGFGVKMPLGQSDAKSNGILLPIDLQPGTGSWDFIFRTNAFYTFKPINGFDFFGTVVYRANGENQQNFSIGNEILLFGGGAYRFGDYVRLLAQLNYRRAGKNKQDGEIIEITGGEWGNFLPGIEFYLSDYLGTRLTGTIPIYHNLNGIQLTTTYSYSVSIFYYFN